MKRAKARIFMKFWGWRRNVQLQSSGMLIRGLPWLEFSCLFSSSSGPS
uniref:DnaJ homolog subfamily B member 6 n=1 Tax=Rhizophora mucronata TaxID=61149 RepID=A0A2P2LBP3_RHIMU